MRAGGGTTETRRHGEGRRVNVEHVAAPFLDSRGPLRMQEGASTFGLSLLLAGLVATALVLPREVAAQARRIATVAGTGVAGFNGDGQPATSAQLNQPFGVAVDGSGNLFIADGTHRIRKVTPDSMITTVAGTGVAGFNGDGQPATSAQLSFPGGVAIDGSGNLFIGDQGNHRVRRVVADTGLITTVAGTGVRGFAGDGGPPAGAQLAVPVGVAVDGSGNLFIVDRANNRVRQVSGAGLITTVTGTGVSGFAGDGGPPAGAQLNQPTGIAAALTGDLFIADRGNQRIRKVTPGGTITTVAGTGAAGFNGDAQPAPSAQLNAPGGVAIDAGGNVFLVDTLNNRIRRIDGLTGSMTTVAGTGTGAFGGFSGDGGPGADARLNRPVSVAVAPTGELYIADRDNHRIRRVAGGIITTVAGSGPGIFGGFGGDGGGATDAILNHPSGVAVAPTGDLYISDQDNQRIRKLVLPTGAITTVAGTGAPGFGGDGGSATGAQLNLPAGLGVDPTGNLYIADQLNHRIRRVDVGTGIISTLAGRGPVGEGQGGFGGDGGEATEAQLNLPSGLAFDTRGNLLVADTLNHRIRRIAGVTAAARPTITGPPADGVIVLATQTLTTFSWTAVNGAALYGLEFTGPGLRFANPNGADPDPVNGYGGRGGGFLVPGTSLAIALVPAPPTGTYQFRVIALTASGQVIGTFSDARTVVIQ